MYPYHPSLSYIEIAKKIQSCELYKTRTNISIKVMLKKSDGQTNIDKSRVTAYLKLQKIILKSEQKM